MKRLIRTFTALLLASVLLVVALGIYAEYTFAQLAGRTGTVLRENYDSIQFMETAIAAAREQDRQLLILLADAQTSATQISRTIQPYRRKFDDALAREEGNITIRGEREKASQLREAGERYFSEVDQFLQRSSSIPAAQLVREFGRAVEPSETQMIAAAEAIRRLNEMNMEAIAAQHRITGPRMIIFGTILSVIALAIIGFSAGRHLVRQVRELQALRSHFVAIASHELRTPVTSMRMALDLLKSGAVGELTPEQTPVVEAAMEDCDRLLALSRQLLDVTKIQSGQIDIHISAIEASRLIADSVAVLQKQLQEKRITLELQPTHASVVADPTKAVWVLTNLLANALRYTPPGGQIKVEAHTHHDDVTFSVSDTGPGIPPDIAAKVFNPYFQAKDRPQQHGRGSAGLGLAIAQEIVSAHKGRIWVEPKPILSGATVSFTLPLAKED